MTDFLLLLLQATRNICSIPEPDPTRIWKTLPWSRYLSQSFLKLCWCGPIYVWSYMEPSRAPQDDFRIPSFCWNFGIFTQLLEYVWVLGRVAKCQCTNLPKIGLFLLNFWSSQTFYPNCFTVISVTFCNSGLGLFLFWDILLYRLSFFLQNWSFSSMSPRVAKGRQGSSRSKGDPRDGWDKL